MIICSHAELALSYIFFWQFASYFLMLAFNYVFSTPTKGIIGFSYLIAFLPSSLLNISITLGALDTFIPLVARLGFPMMSDIVIGAVSGFFFGIALIPLIAVSQHAGNVKKAVKFFFVVTLIGLILAVLFVKPFNTDRAKRTWIQHTHILFPQKSNEVQSMILVSTADPRPLSEPLNGILMHNTPAVLFDDTHRRELWDALYPFSNSVYGSSMMFPADHYDQLNIATLEVLSEFYDQVKDERALELRINYKGSEWSILRFSEELASWSLKGQMPPKQNKLIVIRHVGDHGIEEWKVKLVFKGNKKVVFAVSGTDFAESKDLLELRAQLPNWATASTFVTSVAYYEI